MWKTNFKIVVLFIYFVTEIFGAPPQKIVGGTVAGFEKFTYQVSMRLYGQHFCSGSIISTKHILTAAHCLYNYQHPFYLNQIEVVSGTTSLLTGGTKHSIKNITLHSSFINLKEFLFANDIAIITLKERIQINREHRIIKLASKNKYGGKTAVVSGWGKTGHNLNQPFPYLLKITTSVINAEQCQMLVGQTYYASHICTRDPNPTGTCEGDSGGPLVVGEEVVGVVSFGYDCSTSYPSVYTSVNYYLDFINGVINESGETMEDLYPEHLDSNNNNNNGQVELHQEKNQVFVPTSSPTIAVNYCQLYYLYTNGVWYQVYQVSNETQSETAKS